MEVLRRPLWQPGDAALYRRLDGVGGAGVDGVVVDGGERGLQGRRLREEGGRQDVELAAEDEDAVGGGLRVEPLREREGCLDEEELPVGVPGAGGDVGEGAGEREEEGDGEPLVGEGVAEAERAVEVGHGRRGAERAGGGRDGEREGVPVEEVGGEEGSEVGEEGEVQGLQRGEERGRGELGGERERVDSVEEGVVRRAAGGEREGVGGGGGGGGRHGDEAR